MIWNLKYLDLGIRVWARSSFQDLESCRHFEWMDTYIGDRGLEVEVLPPIEPIQARRSPAVEEEISNIAQEFSLNGELVKLNKHLRQMVELKKQSNMMAGAFYVCIVAISLLLVFRLGI